MQLQSIFSGVAIFTMAVAPALALPEAIPEAIPELYNRAQCIGGDNLVGSGCGPRQKGKTSCSANDRAVVICAGKGPVWKIQNKCQRGSCNNNCVCT